MYAVCSLLGAFAGGLYCSNAAKKRGYDSNDMISLLLITAVGILIGGSLLYFVVSFKNAAALVPADFKLNSPAKLFAVMQLFFGGQIFYGGLFGGMAAAVIYIKKKKLPMGDYSDMIAPAIPLFHAFGRVGCFFGGCCYGVESDIGFIFTHSPVESANALRRFPVQLLEAAFNLLLFLILCRMLKAGKKNLLRLYLSLYAAGRFFLEFIRGDTYRGFVFGTLSTSQLISLIILSAVTVSLIYDRQKRRARYG